MRLSKWFIIMIIVFALFACARTAKVKVEHAEYFESVMKFDVALDKYNKAIEIEPENADLYYRKGRVLVKMAIPLLLEISQEKSVSTDDKDIEKGAEIDVSIDHAKIAEAEKKMMKCHEDAVAAFKKALQLDPTMARVFFPMASCYYQLKEWDQAINYFNRSLETNHENPDAYYFLAECYTQKGESQIARENYQLAAQYGSQKAKEKLQ